MEKRIATSFLILSTIFLTMFSLSALSAVTARLDVFDENGYNISDNSISGDIALKVRSWRDGSSYGFRRTTYERVQLENGNWSDWAELDTSSEVKINRENGGFAYYVRACHRYRYSRYYRWECGYSPVKTIYVTKIPGAPSFETSALYSCASAHEIAWQNLGGNLAYEVDESIHGSEWQTIALTKLRSKFLQNRPAGTDYQYRIRARVSLRDKQGPWGVYRHSSIMRKNKCALPSDNTPLALKEQDQLKPDFPHHALIEPLHGDYNANPDGSFTYRLPIEVPNGMNSLKPDLNFFYSSFAKHGSMNMGWSISGLSQIHRCPAKQNKDGFISDIRPGAGVKQRFCVDGEPLVLRTPGFTSGSDGSEYTTYHYSPVVVKAFGNDAGSPDYFELKDGTGRTAVYGGSNDSKIKANNAASGVTGTIIWRLNSVKDGVGNAMTYTYKNLVKGRVVDNTISSIEYGIDGISDRNIKVKFKWEAAIEYDDLVMKAEYGSSKIEYENAQSGVGSQAMGGAILARNQRIASVDIQLDNSTFNTYKLDYSDSADRRSRISSHLRSITRCFGQTCTAPIQFDWHFLNKGSATACQKYPERFPGGEPALSTDYITSKPLTKNLEWTNGNYRSHLLGNFNNDDLVDIAVVYTERSGSRSKLTVDLAYSRGDSTFMSGENTTTHYFGSPTLHHRLSGDVNLDGYDDIIVSSTSSQGWKAYVFLNNKNGGFNAPTTITLSQNSFIDERSFQIVTGDFNGDSLLDVMAFNFGQGASENSLFVRRVNGLVAYVALGDGSGEFSTAVGGKIADHTSFMKSTSNLRSLFTADFNGDGITDIGSLFVSNSRDKISNPDKGTELFVAFGSETGHFSQPVVQQFSHEEFPLYWQPDISNYNGVQIGDVNGDGIADVLTVQEGYSGILTPGVLEADENHRQKTFVSFISRGDGTFVKKVWEDVMESDTIDETRGSPAVNQCRFARNSQPVVADFNGDGFADVSLGSYYFLLGRGDGSFLKQGGRQIANDTLKPSGGGVNIHGIPIQDTTYGAYAIDVNKDGVPDNVEVLVDRNGLKTGVINYAEGVTQQLLKSIDDGHGRRIEVNYTPIVNRSAYQKERANAYPYLVSGAGLTVVKDLVLDDGTGGRYTKTYTYKNLGVHLEHKLMLGFEEVTETDSRNNAKIVTEFYQDPILAGREKRVQRFVDNNKLIAEDSHQWDYAKNSFDSDGDTHTKYVLKNIASTRATYIGSGNLIGSIDTQSTQFNVFGMPEVWQETRSDGVSGNFTRQWDFNDDWDSYRHLISVTSESRKSDSETSGATRNVAYDYYDNHLLKSKTDFPDLPNLLLKTEYTYNTYGMPTSVTVSGSSDADYPIVTRKSENNYRVVPVAESNAVFSGRSYEVKNTTTDARGNTTAVYYDARFSVKSGTQDENGLKTSKIYSPTGDLTVIRYPDGTQTKMTRVYCDTHCPSTARYLIAVDTQGKPFEVEYFDVMNRVVRKRVQGLHNRIVYIDTIYDSLGRISKKTQPYYYTEDPETIDTFHYDVYGRVKTLDSALNGLERFTYTPLSGQGIQINQSIVRKSFLRETTIETHQKKNLANQVTAVTDADDNVFQHVYTGWDQLMGTKDSQDNEIRMTLDEAGRITFIDDPDLGVREMHYDALGLLRREKDAKLQITTYSYDTLGRMISRSKSEGADVWYYDSGDNGKGKLTGELSYSGAKFDYRYDALGRLQTEKLAVDGQQFQKTTAYDRYGRVKNVVLPDNSVVNYGYSSGGVMNHISLDGHGTLWTLEESNAQGLFLLERFGNQYVTETHYDENSSRIRSKITGRGLRDSTPYSIAQYENFVFDSVGNLVRRIEDSRRIKDSSRLRETFTYDVKNRLINVELADGTQESYTYDDIGNITSKSDYATLYTYGQNNAGPHAVTNVKALSGATINYTYDLNGNLTSGGGRTLSYTSFNKPSSIVDPNGRRTTIAYDANENRIARENSQDGKLIYFRSKAPGGSASEITIKNGVIDYSSTVSVGDRPIAELVKNSSSPASAVYYLHTDHLGSVVSITDSDGVIVSQRSYGAFGEQRDAMWMTEHENNGGDYTLKGFSGHEYLADSRLVHMNARLYDPQLGRFLSADSVIPTIENIEGFNRYSYVYNNPLSLTDPSGNMPVSLVSGGPLLVSIYFAPKYDFGASDTFLFRQVNFTGFNSASIPGTSLSSNALSLNDNIVLVYSAAPELPRSPADAKNPGRPRLTLVPDTGRNLEPGGSKKKSIRILGLGRLGTGAGLLVFSPSLNSDEDREVAERNALNRKMEAELARLNVKPQGPHGAQYALRALRDGTYICFKCETGFIELKTGEVWKFGETTRIEERYSNTEINDFKVHQINEFYGSQREIKVVEKLKIYQYYFINGRLPPGNKVFR